MNAKPDTILNLWILAIALLKPTYGQIPLLANVCILLLSAFFFIFPWFMFILYVIISGVCPNIYPNCLEKVAGNICKFQCPRGQSFSHGNGEIVCGADGTWNDYPPQCIGNVYYWTGRQLDNI